MKIYIYSLTKSLSLMKEKAGKDIVRPGVNRFATTLLSLSSMHEKKIYDKCLLVMNGWNVLFPKQM